MLPRYPGWFSATFLGRVSFSSVGPATAGNSDLVGLWPTLGPGLGGKNETTISPGLGAPETEQNRCHMPSGGWVSARWPVGALLSVGPPLAGNTDLAVRWARFGPLALREVPRPGVEHESARFQC